MPITNDSAGVQAEVDHSVLAVLGRELPFVQVLEDDAVEEEEAAGEQHDARRSCRPSSSSSRIARPRGPVIQSPAAAITKAAGIVMNCGERTSRASDADNPGER